MAATVPARRWAQIFRAFANINRTKIVKILSEREKLTVMEVAEKLDISFSATSKHLLMLHTLDALESRGKDNHVYYWLNPDMPVDVRSIVNLITRS